MSEEKKEVQQRKKYSKRGEVSSKMVSFRADWETLRYLEHSENKGRLINKLVQRWGRSHPWDEYDQEQGGVKDGED